MARAQKTDSAKKTPKKKIAVQSAARKKVKASPVVKKLTALKSASVKTKKTTAKKIPAKAVKVRISKTAASVTGKPKAARKVAPREAQGAKPAKPKSSPAASSEAVKKPVKKSKQASVTKMTVKAAEKMKALPEAQIPQPLREPFFQEVQGVLPLGYGDHFISLMICSPYQLYAYWEIQKHQEIEALRVLGGTWDQVRSILRVYNLTRDTQGGSFFDLELGGGADRWFINVEPDQSYRVEIGLLHADGRFVLLARSNDVTTPRVTMSDILDEEWMGIDFEHMYALSGGFEPGSSSASLRILMEERLRSGDTSGSAAGMVSSGALVKKKDRSFWFTLNCELIVYGATAPDAQVTINGQSVLLRPDGTFTLRYSLPDGKIRLEAKAVSADLVEERTITPTVRRSTERPEPVIRRNRGRG